MRRLTFWCLLAGLTFGLPSAALADEWTKTFTISAKPDLTIQTSDASITVNTWDQNTIEARVVTEGWKIGGRGVSISDHQAGDVVELEVKTPGEVCVICVHISVHHRAEVQIHMPREGKLNLRTGDGRIRLAHFKGDMQVVSRDGSQEMNAVDGTLRAHAGDGHIEADGRFDALDLSTRDGRIRVSAERGSTLAHNWNFQAGDGSIVLTVPSDFPADLDLHTGDGHIILEIPVAVNGRLTEKTIHGKMNGGGNLLTIHTGDGSITIQKS
ncbi:MAG TPA: DUF4097 family beta strand repeat-containing protein [Terriglobales bacterium]|nr:DUF4097 family beta strand repeat-containing protein [Terriglobales bacterium]